MIISEERWESYLELISKIDNDPTQPRYRVTCPSTLTASEKQGLIMRLYQCYRQHRAIDQEGETTHSLSEYRQGFWENLRLMWSGGIEVSNESYVKQVLVRKMRELMPGAVIFRHEDRHIFGVPDISCSWNGVTSWWEVKHANPSMKVAEIQILRCSQLDKNGTKCAFIIFQGDDDACNIVNPKAMRSWRKGTPSAFQCSGFDYTSVVEYIKEIHTNDMG